MSQQDEKIVSLSADNVSLRDELAKLRTSNASLARDRERCAVQATDAQSECEELRAQLAALRACKAAAGHAAVSNDAAPVMARCAP